jgi:hypothetical protein
VAKRTEEERSQKTLDKAAMIREEGGDDGNLPERYSKDGIAERREHVWKFMARRVPQTVMAELLGVSRRTIYEDVQWWKRQCQEHMARVKDDPEAAAADVGLTALRLEGISQAALNDYELARTAQLKNLFLNTAIKAEKTRADMMVQTGFWPKSGEDVRIHQQIDATFTAKLGTVGDDSPLKALDQADSRRKVLDAAELLLKGGVTRLKAIRAAKQVGENVKTIDATVIDVKPKGEGA